MDALNIADGKIREKVEDLIVKGKVKISELKEKVLEILKNLGVSTTADEGNSHHVKAVSQLKFSDATYPSKLVVSLPSNNNIVSVLFIQI